MMVKKLDVDEAPATDDDEKELIIDHLLLNSHQTNSTINRHGESK